MENEPMPDVSLPLAALGADVPPAVVTIRSLFKTQRPYVDPVLGNSNPEQVVHNPGIQAFP
jgi:hypothetical protein